MLAEVNGDAPAVPRLMLLLANQKAPEGCVTAFGTSSWREANEAGAPPRQALSMLACFHSSAQAALYRGIEP